MTTHALLEGSTTSRMTSDQLPSGNVRSQTITSNRLPSRIILVSDTVEAMTSDRPYRRGLPLERVVAELHRFSGTQFDPNCVDAMLRLLAKFARQFRLHE